MKKSCTIGRTVGFNCEPLKAVEKQEPPNCQHWMELCLAETSWQQYKKRTGRSFPRISKRR